MSRLSQLIKRYLHDRKNYQFFIKNYIALGELQRAADTMNTLRHAQILQCTERTAPSGARITILAPHPDDEILGAGGTLALARAAGCQVHTIYLTPGSSKLADTNPLIESQGNAAEFGYTTRFLDLPTDAIPVDDAAAKALADAIAEHRPDFLWLPFLLDDEDDHRRASELLMHAVQRGFLTARPRIWAYQVYTSLPANVIVDITEVAAAKERAINRYTSQRRVRDWAHYALGLNAYNTRFLPGNAPRRYAETFFDLPLADYVDLCASYFRPPAGAAYLKPAYRA